MQDAKGDAQATERERARAAVRVTLHPRSIAIIGASPDRNKLNGRPLHFLRRDGYVGAVWPVNPRYAEIDGLKCYPDVASLPGAPDMAIIAVAAARAAETVAALGAKGCPVAVLFSSGFGELGPHGKEAERALAETAQANGIRLCGPTRWASSTHSTRSPPPSANMPMRRRWRGQWDLPASPVRSGRASQPWRDQEDWGSAISYRRVIRRT